MGVAWAVVISGTLGLVGFGLRGHVCSAMRGGGFEGRVGEYGGCLMGGCTSALGLGVGGLLRGDAYQGCVVGYGLAIV